ncbi:MAG TPA: extracellular solute-binding protein, partial [Dehalococcoidia bacterium]|nr:extracellular solute-binding protein [Dehalococcoidia bacterium]
GGLRRWRESDAGAGPPTAAVKPAWEVEWEQVLEAAKREGKVAVAGPDGAGPRRALTEPFEAKYGIKVEFQGFQGAEFAARLREERKASQYLWDVFIGGTTTMIVNIKPIGDVLEPIEPAMILPEVKDLKSWREGRLLFFEKDKMGLATHPYTRAILARNTDLVKPDDVKSYKDLLDPKWKGKITGRDPTVSGPGQASFLFFYRHPDLGPNFIRTLIKQQEVTFTRDDRQALESAAQGKYAFVLGFSSTTIAEMKRQAPSLSIEQMESSKVKEGGDVSTGVASISRISRPPHPNAAKVYINWFLSKEGQSAFSDAINQPSWRADVPWKGEAWLLPRPGAIETYSEEAQRDKDPLLAVLQEVSGR